MKVKIYANNLTIKKLYKQDGTQLLLLSILSKDTGSTKGKPVRGAPRLTVAIEQKVDSKAFAIPILTARL